MTTTYHAQHLAKYGAEYLPGRGARQASRTRSDGLAELRGVLMNEHQWRQRVGLDP